MAEQKKSVIFTTTALNDLINIQLFLEGISEIYADKMVDELYERAFDLESFSEMGQREPLLIKYSIIYRYLVQGDYKIIYSIENDEVIINRIFDTRQNPKKLKIDPKITV
jgi:toxin ParE1/3/4